MNILKGKLNKRDMARLSDQGYLKYKKIKGRIYKFTLYPEPIKELELNNEKS